MAATFYTVSDRRFFVGTVALLNSLRLTGNDGPIVVLDLGLEPLQRSRLEAHVRVVAPPAAIVENPLLAKPFAHLLEPQGTVVVIDSDMIVTSRLDDLLTLAERGSICLFSDHEAQRDRWFAEWQGAFSLSAAPRREPYLNSGFVAFSVDRWPSLLPAWWQACRAIPATATRAFGAAYEQPFWDGDQDALNAVLMAEVPPGAVAEQAPEEAPTARRLLEVTVHDEQRLSCTFRGSLTRLLHQTGHPKPWERGAWMKVRANGYTRLAPRVLSARDVALHIDERELPPWLRRGGMAQAGLSILSALNGAARAVAHRVPAGPRARVKELAGRIARRMPDQGPR